MGERAYDFRVGARTFKVRTDAADRLIGDALAREGTWEPWQLELYARLIRPESTCYDIGGNIGTSALAMAHYASSGRVFAFEPVKRTYELLRDNLERNGADRVEAVNIGLSNVDTEAQIVVDRALLGNAHQVSSPVALPKTAYLDSMSLRRLDAWRAETGAPAPDLVKIDVEGFEIEVLEGGEQTFADPDLILIAEFAVIPQRVAGGGKPFPGEPKDLRYYEALKARFRHIFLIGRDCKLHPVRSYAHLRVLMMRGYSVDDLLCCQAVPPQVADLIAEPTTPKWLTTGALFDRRGSFVTLNRDDDGWAQELGDLGAVSGVVAHLCEPAVVTIDLAGLHQAYADAPLGPVMVVTGDRHVFAEDSVTLYLDRGVNWILLEAQHAFTAKKYFNNPSDPRRIGFNYRLRGLE